MYISAKVDYATRALLALAVAEPGVNVKGEDLAVGQKLPLRFVENILADLRRGGLVSSHRGLDGGYRLARPPAEITVADVVRALEGYLADVRGLRPEDARYEGPAEHLRDVWVALRCSMRTVLESTTLADIASGQLPEPVTDLLASPDAWKSRE